MKISHIPHILISPDSLAHTKLVLTLREADFVVMASELMRDDKYASTTLTTAQRTLHVSNGHNGVRVWVQDDESRGVTFNAIELLQFRKVLTRLSREDVHVGAVLTESSLMATVDSPQPAFSAQDDDDVPF